VGNQGITKLDDNSGEIMARLVARIVHDFNNPLAAIIGFADLLRNPSVAPEKKDRYVGRIYEQASKLSLMVENMSAFSSVPTPQNGRFDLGRTVMDLYALKVDGLRTAGIRFECEIPDEPLHVFGDRAVTSRVVNSLLTNVEQVFKENPSSEKELLIRCSVVDGTGSVDLFDSGPGVTAGTEETIFDPFVSTRRSGGLGLGLSVSRSLAEKMGGTLDLVREPDPPLCGAHFRLRLGLHKD